MEHIVGPVFGYYLACYTIEAEDGHHAYAKLCAERPTCVWETGAVLRKVAAGPYPDAVSALRGVVGRSERRLARRAARQSDWALLGPSRPTPLAGD